MPKLLALLTLIGMLLSCSSQPEQSNKFFEQCQKIKAECQTDCVEKSFRACFVDTKQFPKGPYDAFKNCHAIHVGELCAPCKQLFSLNFGGAMKSVKCEEFFSAIERKNEDCGNCLEQLGDSPFSY